MYDPRYLQGVVLFNRADYFAAHEVWEEVWRDCPSQERRFYQGLIQAAVAIYQWNRSNARGARRLFYSGRAYMESYAPTHLGLDVPRFWQSIEAWLYEILVEPDHSQTPKSIPARPALPQITLQPSPEQWPLEQPYPMVPERNIDE